MQNQCVIVDSDSASRGRLISVLQDTLQIDVQSAPRIDDALTVLRSKGRHVLLLRFDDPDLKAEQGIERFRLLKIPVTVVALLAKAEMGTLRTLLQMHSVADVLTDDASPDRITQALQKALGTVDAPNARSHYLGFLSFVGAVPTFQQRKALTRVNVGVLQNRSLRLAIEYWRKTPNSQMVAVCLNADEMLTSRDDDNIAKWVDFNIRPWQIALYEAQQHYVEYWKDPIREKLMPVVIPTLLSYGLDDAAPLDAEEGKRVILKVEQATQDGHLTEALGVMGIAFRTDSFVGKHMVFDDFIEKITDQMEKVDQSYPELTRPPSETGYEDFVPDVVKPKESGSSNRMAYRKDKRR